MSGSSARQSKPQPEPESGGPSIADLLMLVTRQGETIGRLQEALRILADRVNALEGKEDESADAEPKHYLSGKPIFR